MLNQTNINRLRRYWPQLLVWAVLICGLLWATGSLAILVGGR